MSSRAATQRHALELYELKKKAVKFYQKNNVPEKIEEILNSLFYQNPEDVYGSLAEYFSRLSNPASVSRITALEILDCKGQPTIEVDVYCIRNGTEKFVCTCKISSFSVLPDGVSMEKKDMEERERSEGIAAAIALIDHDIIEMLKGVNPCNQFDVDTKLRELASKLLEEYEKKLAIHKEDDGSELTVAAAAKEIPAKDGKVSSAKNKKKMGSAKSGVVVIVEPREMMLPGCDAFGASSQVVARASAIIKDQPLYQYISHLYSNQEDVIEYRMPIPLVTVLCSGKSALGKQNLIKEVLLVPKPGQTFQKALKNVSAVYHQIRKMLFAKYGASCNNVNDVGGFCPVMDKTEMLLDVVVEAIDQQQLNEQVNIMIDCAAHEIFDHEKCKYEILTSMLKTSDDLIDVYVDFIARYPAIVGIIDPLRKQDVDAWQKLIEKISDKCFVIGDYIYPRAERLVTEGNGGLRSSAAVLKLQQQTTITDIINATKQIKETNGECIISGVRGDTEEDFIADLAVGIGAKFVKFGGILRGERTSKYNRLLKIEQELRSKCLAIPYDSLDIPNILPPPAQEDDANTLAPDAVS
ncbi:enolase 4-like [Antedon mediterranea]|uniref:enolase 4-like n=1 Tax=Antedon mediterranea TaxID=105859 RepID=UPI003AF7EDD1